MYHLVTLSSEYVVMLVRTARLDTYIEGLFLFNNLLALTLLTLVFLLH